MLVGSCIVRNDLTTSPKIASSRSCSISKDEPNVLKTHHKKLDEVADNDNDHDCGAVPPFAGLVRRGTYAMVDFEGLSCEKPFQFFYKGLRL